MSPRIITDNVFKHRKEIGSEDLNDLVVDGGTEKVKKALIEKWKCEPEGLIAVPSLTVNSAGKLSGAKWYTMGIIPKEINIKVNQLHIEAEEDVYLSFKNMDISIFPFYNKRRNMSGWLDSSALEFTMFRKVQTKKVVVTSDKYEEIGMRGFCLRLCVMPITATTASMTLAMFPMAKEELKDKAHEVYTKTSCPQVALPIGINNAKYAIIKMGVMEPAGAKVGMGVWPIIEDIRTAEEAAGIFPSSLEVRKALHSFMRSCKGLNNKTAKKVLEAMEDTAELNKNFDPEFLWPEAPETESEDLVDEFGEWHRTQAILTTI